VVRSAADDRYEKKGFHSSQMYKICVNYYIINQVLFGKIVIISISKEGLTLMCQTELGLKQITHASMLAIELGLRFTM
jgi:hypothetical protein